MGDRKYFALRQSASGMLDIELSLRISMALLAEHSGIPFVQAPIATDSGLCVSELTPEVLNQKWKEYFRLLTQNFYDGRTQEAERLYLNEGLEEKRSLLNTRLMVRDKLLLEYDFALVLQGFFKKMRAPSRSQTAKAQHEIDTPYIRAFAARSHAAYAGAFGLEVRESCADGVLQAVFIVQDDILKSPFFYDRLPALLDFVEERARSIGCSAEIRIFTSFATDAQMTPAFYQRQAEILAAACARPGVHHHAKPSFEELLHAAVMADLCWASGSLYIRSFFRELLFFLARPGQIALEAISNGEGLNINSCFLMWDGENLLYERDKFQSLLARVGRDTTAPRRRRQLPIRCTRSNMKVALGIVDGIGSYMLKAYVLQSIADYHGMQYVHIPPMHLDHNYRDEPGWAQKWSGFFMVGEGYPRVDEVFAGGTQNIHHHYHLQRLSCLRAASPTSCSLRSLLVCSMANYWDWPVPEHFLAQKVAATQHAFQEKHKSRPDRFAAEVLNVAVHIRKEDDGTLPMMGIYKSTHEIFMRKDLNFYLPRIVALHKALKQLGAPFHIHVYSDMSRRAIQPLLEMEDMHIQLHLAQESEDDTLDFLEMARADIFMLSPSRTSYVCALYAKSGQVQVVTDAYTNNLMHLVVGARQALYVEEIDLLQNVRLYERGLRQGGLL